MLNSIILNMYWEFEWKNENFWYFIELTFTEPSVVELSLLLILLMLLDELWLRLDFFSFKTECWRSSTVGQMQVGGNRWTRLTPSLHSGSTWLAHLLCNWKQWKYDEIFYCSYKILYDLFNFYDKSLITYCEMTPSAMESGNSIITFDLFPAFGTFSVRVPFNPMMKHLLCRSGWFNIGGDARRRSPLNASFVNRVLAYWWE